MDAPQDRQNGSCPHCSTPCKRERHIVDTSATIGSRPEFAGIFSGRSPLLALTAVTIEEAAAQSPP